MTKPWPTLSWRVIVTHYSGLSLLSVNIPKHEGSVRTLQNAARVSHVGRFAASYARQFGERPRRA